MTEAIEHWTQNTHVGYIKECSSASSTFPYKFSTDSEEFIIPVQSMNNKQESGKYNDKMIKRRLKTRTKSELILEIKKLAKSDIQYLNYSFLRMKGRNDMLFEAVKHFSGWRNAVKAAGFRPIQKRWVKNKIIRELLIINTELGHTPTRDEVRKIKRNDLERAATRYFGSWNKGLIAAGLKPNKKTDWTKEEIIIRLKTIAKRLGHSPSMRHLKNSNNHGLLNMGLKFFGTYNDFLQAAGLKVVLEMNKWPKDKIIKEIQEIHEQLGRTPRRNELASMKRYDLINAAETYFDSWSDALIASGLIPNPDVLNDNKTWREWENLIFDYLSSEGINFEKKRYIKKVGYPDVFIPAKKKIIEIKINCSDNSVKKDIEKYLPYCDTLEIWYLYGKPFGILSNKVKFLGPNSIKHLLNKHPTLLKKFNKIKEETEENKRETKNKKSHLAWQRCKLD